MSRIAVHRGNPARQFRLRRAVRLPAAPSPSDSAAPGGSGRIGVIVATRFGTATAVAAIGPNEPNRGSAREPRPAVADETSLVRALPWSAWQKISDRTTRTERRSYRSGRGRVGLHLAPPLATPLAPAPAGRRTPRPGRASCPPELAATTPGAPRGPEDRLR